MLFSEPKIPHTRRCDCNRWRWSSFSALQRAENSSTSYHIPLSEVEAGFSALQRAENSSSVHATFGALVPRPGFSALQRAENSSLDVRTALRLAGVKFQCSSASRKFLSRCGWTENLDEKKVSVLFSEPKIPHRSASGVVLASRRFQCSSASRKFLTHLFLISTRFS